MNKVKKSGNIMASGMILSAIVLLGVFIITLPGRAYSLSYSQKYQSNPGSTLGYYAVNAVHNKIYLSVGGNWVDGFLKGGSLVTLDMNDSGNFLSTLPVQDNTGCTGGPIALDAKRLKLYVSAGDSDGTVYIYNIGSNGLIDVVTPPVAHSHKWSNAIMKTIHIDLVHDLLITTGYSNANTRGVIVLSKLGSTGLPINSQGDTFTGTASTYEHFYSVTPLYVTSDLSTNYLYIADGVYHSGMIKLNSSTGYPQGDFYSWWGGGFGYPTILDSANRKLYLSNYNGDGRIWNLSDTGFYESLVDLTGTIGLNALSMDSARRKLFRVRSSGASRYLIYESMDTSGKPAVAFDSVTISGNATSDISYITYEPFFSKIYLTLNSSSGPNYLYVYDAPDSSLAPVTINNADTITDVANVTLKLQHSNPNFILVGGDLTSVDTPINNLNTWISCGGGFWRDASGTRTANLTVNATLSSGYGDKTIEIWHSACAGPSFSGMMKKATAKIKRIAPLATPAEVSSITLSRINYSGARVDYNIKDFRDRNVSIAVQYKTSTKDWANATVSGAGSGGEGTDNLSATISGSTHYFIWDMEKDLEESAKDVQVRIKANNPDATGEWTESDKYSVPDWTGNDIKATNASVRTPDNSYLYRVRLEWTGVADTTPTYEVQKKQDDGNWDWVTVSTGTIVEVENLSETPTYSFKVRLRTKEGLFSSYSKSVSISLAGKQYGRAIVGRTGGKVFIEDYDENPDNDARVEVEEGTFREDVTIGLEKFSAGDYEITANKSSGINLTEADFKKAVTIKLSYNKAEIQKIGWKEDNLAIFYYDGVNWNSIGGKVDKTNSLITAKVNHFSRFRISENIQKPVVDVIPDYFSPNGDGIADSLRFYFPSQEMVESNKIEIYDISGKTVRVIKSDGMNTLSWDGRSEDGALCETGLYVCVIEAGGSKTVKSVRLVR